MLVLTRKRTEMIKIDEDIVITVIHTSKGTVKLGIQAPANVRVLRAELDGHPAMKREANVDANHGYFQAASVRPAVAESADEMELAEVPMFSAEGYPKILNDFDTDYLTEVEDQALLCLVQ